jgi:hypothetical protein
MESEITVGDFSEKRLRGDKSVESWLQCKLLMLHHIELILCWGLKMLAAAAIVIMLTGV